MDEIRFMIGLDDFRTLIRGQVVDKVIDGKKVKVAMSDIGWVPMVQEITEAHREAQSKGMR